MTDQFLVEVAKQGLLGVLLALCISIIFVLVKLLLSEKDKRIQDANTYRNDLVAPIEKITDYIKIIGDKGRQ